MRNDPNAELLMRNAECKGDPPVVAQKPWQGRRFVAKGDPPKRSEGGKPWDYDVVSFHVNP